MIIGGVKEKRELIAEQGISGRNCQLFKQARSPKRLTPEAIHEIRYYCVIFNFETTFSGVLITAKS